MLVPVCSQARVERGDEKSVAASDVRRWSGIRNTIEGRTMLRTLFRVAVREREARAETEEALVEVRERGGGGETGGGSRGGEGLVTWCLGNQGGDGAKDSPLVGW